MKFYPFILPIVLAACAGLPVDTSPVRATISTRDMAMNRPNTDTREAVFRMLADGTGTVEFIAHPDGAQPVTWTLDGNRFCILTDEGLMQTFGCAALRLSGDHITLAHIGSDAVATGVMVPR
ncbi:MAG: hypothetical protein ACSHWY_13615 [Octadecabacter sp.]